MSLTTVSIIEQVVNQIEEQKALISVDIKYLDDGAVAITGWIKSRSVRGEKHMTRIIVRGSDILGQGCGCKGYQYHRKCWHTAFLKNWAQKHGFLSS